MTISGVLRNAVNTANHTRRGAGSGFEGALVKGVESKVAKDAVVLVDWAITGGSSTENQNFGGYVMPPDQAPVWEDRRSRAVSGRDQEFTYNEIHEAGFPTASFQVERNQEQEVDSTWGRAYSLVDNPLGARLVSFTEPKK